MARTPKITTPPKISVIERRLQGPSVFRTASQPIPLREPNVWTLRWVNTKVHPNRLWDMLHTKGWVYATADDLACSVEEIGALLRDDRIVMGERGEEVLMKIPSSDYAAIAKKKDEETRRQTFGKQQLKKAITEGVAIAHGDRAAEFMHRNVENMTVQDARAPEEDV